VSAVQTNWPFEISAHNSSVICLVIKVSVPFVCTSTLKALHGWLACNLEQKLIKMLKLENQAGGATRRSGFNFTPFLRIIALA
jgi:hypothetical protein